MKKVKLSIIIPVYNELNTVLELIKRVKNERHEKEIIIVDDGSTDGTTDLLRQIKDENIKIIFHDKNRGKGYSVRTAIEQITGDIVIIQDADLEYYPDEYGILIERIVQKKADVVYGTRFLGVHRVFYFYHFLGNLFLNLIVNFAINANLTDLMTGFKAFRADILKELVLKAERFGIEVEITTEVFKRRLRVYEVPISYEGREYEEGKKIRWPDFFDCIYWLIRSSLRAVDAGSETLLRTRLMTNNNLWTYRKIEPFLGKKILEIGSGIGTVSKYLVFKGRNVTLSDINDKYIDYLNRRFIGNPRVNVIKIDAANFDAKSYDDKFDTIIGINILEHIENDLDTLKRLRGGLIENGRLLLLVPAHKILFGILDANLKHYRRYSKSELIKKIENAGFIIEKIEYMNFLSAIGWFINFKMLKRGRMPIATILLIDKIINFVMLIEKHIKFPFGLSLFAVARKKG